MLRSLLVLFLFTLPLLAQEPYWVPLDGPKGGPVQFLERHPDGRLFVGAPTTLGWTSDLGKTWHLHPIPGGGTLYDITISPEGNLYVCTHLGLYKSTTDGATFERLHNGDARQLHIKPDGTLINVIKPVLGISIDDGATWDYVYSGINTADDATRNIIATDDDGGIVLIDYNNGAFRSTDNGASWEHTLQVDGAVDVAYNKRTDTYYAVLRGVSSNSYRNTVWYSNDIGATWDSLSFSRDGLAVVTRVECTEEYTFVYSVRGTEAITLRNHAAAWDTLSFPDGFSGDMLAKGDELIAGAIHGIVYTDDFGATWDNIGEDVQLSTVNDMYTDREGSLYASGHSLFRTSNGGGDWLNMGELFWVTDIELDYMNRVYISSAQGLYRYDLNTKDGAFFQAGSWPNWSYDVEMASDGTLYVEGNGSLIKIFSNGDTVRWLGLNYGWAPQASHYVSLGVNRDEIFITSTGEGIYRSTDHGVSWTHSNELRHHATDMRFNSKDNMYISTEEGTVQKSTDRGLTWEVLFDAGHYLEMIRILPNDDLLIRKGSQILVSRDDGATWVNMTGNLEGHEVWGLTNDLYGYLYAGVEDRGVYKTAMPVSVGGTPEAAGEFSLEIHPNPVRVGGAAQVRYGMPVAGSVTMLLHDALGREVRRISKRVEPGEHSESIATVDLTPGVYYYSLLANGQKKTDMLVVR